MISLDILLRSDPGEFTVVSYKLISTKHKHFENAKQRSNM
jgi:hypothetical protein